MTTTSGTPSRSRTPLDQAAVDEALAGLDVGRVLLVPATGSTSTDLVAAVTADPAAWPDRSLLVTDHQRAGRGRAGRSWTTPQGAALTLSVLLRPTVPLDRFGWVPLIAGLAVVRGIGEVTGIQAGLKWPNDVLLRAADGSELAGWGPHRKVAGVLSELVTGPAGPAVVVGIGLNVSQTSAELPVPSATSLALALEGARTGRTGRMEGTDGTEADEASGAVLDRAALLRAVVSDLIELDGLWRAGDGSVQREVASACLTLGATVQVELPGGGVLEGVARGFSAEGALEVVDVEGRVRTVLAGDVHHLRAPGAPVTSRGR